MTGSVPGWGQSADGMPLVSPSPLTGGMTVVSDEDEWTARVLAADAAVAELKSAIDKANMVLKSNYFGQGCVEGQKLFDDLKKYLHGEGGFVTGIAEQYASAKHLREACRAAHPRIAAVDEVNARGIST